MSNEWEESTSECGWSVLTKVSWVLPLIVLDFDGIDFERIGVQPVKRKKNELVLKYWMNNWVNIMWSVSDKTIFQKWVLKSWFCLIWMIQHKITFEV